MVRCSSCSSIRSRSSSASDGYYGVGLDLDRNGSFETTRYFYRLAGDVNGDRTVDSADRSAVWAAIGQTGPDLQADANGSGSVNFWDRWMAWSASGHGLDGSLPVDD